jgi:hypothetical protein
MIKFYEKLKERWGADSLWQVLVIVIIFSISGSSALFVRRFVFDQIGFTASTPFWEQVIAWALVVFPSYQILFLMYGFLLGQFDFVWRFEKKTLSRIKRLFVHKVD